jgi:hypothetical protein
MNGQCCIWLMLHTEYVSPSQLTESVGLRPDTRDRPSTATCRGGAALASSAAGPPSRRLSVCRRLTANVVGVPGFLLPASAALRLPMEVFASRVSAAQAFGLAVCLGPQELPAPLG